MILSREIHVDHLNGMKRLVPWVVKSGLLVFGEKTGERLLRFAGKGLVSWVYWWGIPIGQMMFAL